MLILHSLPKAELHLHLEGSIEPETLRELGAPEYKYQFADFAGFIEAFKWVTSYLRSPQDYALVTRHLLANLERQNVQYAEITLSAGVAAFPEHGATSTELLTLADQCLYESKSRGRDVVTVCTFGGRLKPASPPRSSPASCAGNNSKVTQ